MVSRVSIAMSFVGHGPHTQHCTRLDWMHKKTGRVILHYKRHTLLDAPTRWSYGEVGVGIAASEAAISAD